MQVCFECLSVQVKSYFDFQALLCIVPTTPAQSFHNISRLQFVWMNTNTTMFTDHFCPVDKEHEAFRVFLSQQVVSVGAMSAETNKMKFK